MVLIKSFFRISTLTLALSFSSASSAEKITYCQDYSARPFGFYVQKNKAIDKTLPTIVVVDSYNLYGQSLLERLHKDYFQVIHVHSKGTPPQDNDSVYFNKFDVDIGVNSWNASSTTLTIPENEYLKQVMGVIEGLNIIEVIPVSDSGFTLAENIVEAIANTRPPDPPHFLIGEATGYSVLNQDELVKSQKSNLSREGRQEPLFDVEVLVKNGVIQIGNIHNHNSQPISSRIGTLLDIAANKTTQLLGMHYGISTLTFRYNESEGPVLIQTRTPLRGPASFLSLSEESH